MDWIQIAFFAEYFVLGCVITSIVWGVITYNSHTELVALRKFVDMHLAQAERAQHAALYQDLAEHFDTAIKDVKE